MYGTKSNKNQGKYGHLELELNSEIGRIEKFQKRRHSEISANIEGLKNEMRRMNKPDINKNNSTGRRNSITSAYPSAQSKKSIKDQFEVPSSVVMEARTLLKVVEKRRKSLEMEKKLYLENLESKSRASQKNTQGLRRLSLDLNVPFDWISGAETKKNDDEPLKLPGLKTEFNRFKDPVSKYSGSVKVVEKKKLTKSYSDPAETVHFSDEDEAVFPEDLKPPDSKSGRDDSSKGVKETSFELDGSFSKPPRDNMRIRRFSMPEFHYPNKSPVVPLATHAENENDESSDSVTESLKEPLSAREKSSSRNSSSVFLLPHRRASISVDISDFVPKFEKHKHSKVPGHSEKRLLMRRNSAYLLTKHLLEIKESLPTQTLLEIERLKHEENVMFL